MPSDPRAVQSVFLKAAELSAADRPTLLDRACAGDASLRRRVESLLAVHDRSGSFLDRPLVSLPPTYVPEFADGRPEPLAGQRVGPYELLDKLGEGGMGSVWVAAQERPVRRHVALKLIKPGLDSAKVVRRFAAERQALALMDHANIARILDAGVADSGRPYFAMELVQGVPVTAYCDGLNLSVRERLELFVPVCRAVQHAHQKGVVHRDLKPSNVLVCRQDGRPVPKVIDFGVAKAVDGKLTDDTAFTGVGVVLGTPHYMSPEQAELGALDVDTRCDVYSLGVLLYELLTGTTPLDAAALRTVGFAETLRRIREEEAPRPSTRLAASRPALTRQVRGDLDWIVMKCLEKDRTRRYESAEALARDAERYLADEPVEAGPPSAGYRVRKFVRRHRSAVAAAALVAVALVLGLAGTSAGLVWAFREQAAAERRLTQVENGTDLLAAIFDDLDPGAADRAGTSLNVVLGERLDHAAARLAAAAEVGDPLTVARLQQALGSSYFGLGYPDKAIDLLAAARRTRELQLGPRHPDTLRTLNSLVCAYLDAGRSQEAVSLGETVVRLRRGVLGPDHPHTLTSMNNLVVAYSDAGRPDDALPLAAAAHRRAAVALGPAHRDALIARSNLASLYREAGRVTEAVPLFEDILRLRRETLGPKHPETLRSLSLLAGAYLHADRPRDAVPLWEEVLRVRRETLGPRHPETLGSLGQLAVMLRRAGRLAESIPLAEEALRLRTEVLGPEHPHTLLSMNGVAAAYREAARPADALRLFQDVLRLTTTALGIRHPDTLRAKCNVGAAYRDVGRDAEAVPLLEEARRQMADTFGSAHADTLRCTGHLIEAYRATGRPDLALSLSDESRADPRATVPPRQP